MNAKAQNFMNDNAEEFRKSTSNEPEEEEYHSCNEELTEEMMSLNDAFVKREPDLFTMKEKVHIEGIGFLIKNVFKLRWHFLGRGKNRRVSFASPLAHNPHT